MQRIFNENGRMDSTVYLLNHTSESLQLYFNRMANPEPFVFAPGEIAQCDGGVATIFMNQTWLYDILPAANGDPEGAIMTNQRFKLSAFNTAEEAQAAKEKLVGNAVKSERIEIEDYTPPTEKKVDKKMNYVIMRKDALVALAKEKYGAEFSEDATRQEIIDFLRENDGK